MNEAIYCKYGAAVITTGGLLFSWLHIYAALHSSYHFGFIPKDIYVFVPVYMIYTMTSRMQASGD